MPRIHLVLEDDNGNPLPDTDEQIYVLDGKCDTLPQIEDAVESFKNQALLLAEQTLLIRAQQRFESAGEKQTRIRNATALLDLVGYLEKHPHEIIDYGRRLLTGKPIGSGQMEKAVDQVIGIRQKKKGMSWSQIGSHALALLKSTGSVSNSGAPSVTTT